MFGWITAPFRGDQRGKRCYLQASGVTSEAAPSSSVLRSILWAVFFYVRLSTSPYSLETAIQTLLGYKNYKHVNVSSLIGKVNNLSGSAKCNSTVNMIRTFRGWLLPERKNPGRSFWLTIFFLQIPVECSQRVAIKKNAGILLCHGKEEKYHKTRFHAPGIIAGEMQYLHLQHLEFQAAGRAIRQKVERSSS